MPRSWRCNSAVYPQSQELRTNEFPICFHSYASQCTKTSLIPASFSSVKNIAQMHKQMEITRHNLRNSVRRKIKKRIAFLKAIATRKKANSSLPGQARIKDIDITYTPKSRRPLRIELVTETFASCAASVGQSCLAGQGSYYTPHMTKTSQVHHTSWFVGELSI